MSEIHEMSSEHTQECVDKAWKMSLGTINALYKETHEHCHLNDCQMDLLKDAVQTLAYLKQMK